ncbi:MAG: sugar phosphorylase [Planctomycetes bacterium]|nr:sugar phosphorylase [Planctomycetota bacterium]
MPFSERFRTRALERLTRLYGEEASACLNRIVESGSRNDSLPSRSQNELWTEQDVVLITYADQVRRAGCTPLAALNRFLLDHHLDQCINTVHLLPFFPYSTDDGFSVIDYKQVDPACGDWADVTQLGKSFDLMFDLVLNHCSKEHRWFRDYLKGKEPYNRYFLEVDSATDLSGVVRPRSAPVLTPFETSLGTRNVWTTFSDDQIDLNFSNPDVLCEMIDVLLFYVQHGARIIRLDAVAYLWKTLGTSCIHLPETHTVVKLLRDILEEFAPGTILLTETNVPHRENVSYFGDGDEAQMVYQFSLAGLLLDAFLSRDAGPMNEWLGSLEPAGAGMTFFNFTASHDGIGVRPLEGLVSQERLDRLIEAVRLRGGRVSTKRDTVGSDSPYELNITYFSALVDPDERDPELSVRRFLSSQAVMLALQGIPGIYFHSLVGTENDLAGVERTGRSRSINRRKFSLDELGNILADENSTQQRVFDEYRNMIRTRVSQPAFHPDAAQRVIDLNNPALIAFLRTSLDAAQNILVLTNVSGEPASVDLFAFDHLKLEVDLLGGENPRNHQLTLTPFTTAWLASM